MGAKYVFNPLTGNLDTTDVVAFNGEVEAGTAAAPSIFFTGDNTGIYSPGADQLAISTNGTERLRITSDGKLGLGISSPPSTLSVVDSQTNPVQSYFGSNQTNATGRIGVGSTGNAIPVFADNFVIEGRTGGIAVGSDSNSSILFYNASGRFERARIDSSAGRLLVGASSSRAVGNFTPHLLLEGIDANSSTFSVVRNNNAPGWPQIILAKTRGTAAGGVGLVIQNDRLGEIKFAGGDGTTANSVGASIFCDVDNIPGTNDMPGRLVFSVTADGASSPTEAMRIKSTRVINFSNAPVYADNAAAKTGGLVNGDVYRTSTGDLKIVYT